MPPTRKNPKPKRCPTCGRDDLRGDIGLTMHMNRSHNGKNWSTKPKPKETAEGAAA